jgi:hypothetical protein
MRRDENFDAMNSEGARLRAGVLQDFKIVPRIPTGQMIRAAVDVIRNSAGGIVRLGPGLGVREVWEAMYDAASREQK